MRISDWSSDVCSSDLGWHDAMRQDPQGPYAVTAYFGQQIESIGRAGFVSACHTLADVFAVGQQVFELGPNGDAPMRRGERKSAGEGKRVSGRVAAEGRGSSEKKRKNKK